MLPRWRHEVERELPDLITRLIDDGAARTNLLHLQPEQVTHGWQPGDEQFETVTARRPVLEATLSRLTRAQVGVTVRRGTRATQLLVRHGPRTARVIGLRTAAGDLRADLVVDAGGRRTPVPGWVRGLNGSPPREHTADCGFVYYSRHFRAYGDRLPAAQDTLLTHFPAISALTLPGDAGTYCLVLVCAAGDRGFRSLRHEDSWTAVASCLPPLRPWLSGGDPTTGVMPLAGLADVSRSYVRDGRPVVTGLVAIGDAANATNPSLGRGATLGLLEACALRDTLREAWPTAAHLVRGFADGVARRVTPWVELTTRFDRHRLAEMHADAAGVPYRPADPTWSMTTGLLAGARHDPMLARASSRIAGMLATPSEILSDPAVAQRVAAHSATAHYPPDGPSRSELLAAAQRPSRTAAPSITPSTINQQPERIPS
jgi:2-polyprenyl-6-methoxyphenol hydroxylase-like FAD-dependent oxidoreductase